VETLEWKVAAPSKVHLNLKLDQPVTECTSSSATASRELHFGVSKTKFLALYEELSQAQLTLRSLGPSN
jgi:hypothetical protein